jgi:hypothetical protein
MSSPRHKKTEKFFVSRASAFLPLMLPSAKTFAAQWVMRFLRVGDAKRRRFPNNFNPVAGIDANLVNQCVRKLFRELSFLSASPAS